ncbi:NUDIX domain-containing protein [Candidatus Woesearchaeota archaeon]|nr:NUDIX domain-containing protein [Candidatus Woesearchaeota archaeon]
MQNAWEDIRTYDDLYHPKMREFALEVMTEATHKCEMLKRKGEQFRFCGLQNPDDQAPVSHDSPLMRHMVSGLIRLCYDHEGLFCPDYREQISRIRAEDESLLEKACKKSGVKYIPPNRAEKEPMQERYGEYCRILGRNYPVKEFPDRRRTSRMPYTFRHGKDIPIVCSASLIVTEKTGNVKSYLLMQEAKKGSGAIRRDEGKIDIPGGGLKWGETFEECAKREFLEERGIEPELTGLVALVQRINRNNRIIFKAVYTGELTKKQRSSIRNDSKGFMFFEVPVIRWLFGYGKIKTPDIMLLINRMEKGMVSDPTAPSEEQMLMWGWD